MIAKVLAYIREHGLIPPGSRVIAAVSGGADSVALLRLLLDLRPELAVGLAVAHFNHRIRGEESDADERFVRELAERFELQLHCGSGDTRSFARENKMSLETAARELRHRFFAGLTRSGDDTRIATAHTQDDQAETVLMRVLRGTGSRGLAGIAPLQREKFLVRPMLCVTRAEIEAWLNGLGQTWRDDSTNRDLHHTRNRVRHELLPALRRDFNPALDQTLADLAEIAREEEDCWNAQITTLAARLVRPGKPSRSGRSSGQVPVLAIEPAGLLALPVALQRRLLRFMASELGTALEFKHVRELLEFARTKKPGKGPNLPGGLAATRTQRELQLSQGAEKPPVPYSYRLPLPGEVEIPELGMRLRAQVISTDPDFSGYNPIQHPQLLDRALLAPELMVRNWQPGDRYFPAHTRSPRKVKELLQRGRIGHDLLSAERSLWPVIESAGEIVWMRGFPVPQAFAAKSGEAVLIEEITSATAGDVRDHS